MSRGRRCSGRKKAKVIANAPRGWLTIDEAAQYASVSVSAVKHWLRCKRLPAYRFPGCRRVLVHPREVDRVVADVFTTE